MADVATQLRKQFVEVGARPDIERPRVAAETIGDVSQDLSIWEKLGEKTWLRRLVVIVVLAIIWELYARYASNELMFPSLSDTVAAWWDGMRSGVLIRAVYGTMQVLLLGYAVAIGISALITTLAISTRVGTDVLATMTAMFNPLPAIAILPLALLWFGLGITSLIFVIVHSVLWAVSLNTLTGFLSVSQTQRMVGRNYGLRGVNFVLRILVPAAFPSILSGLKIGWAFAWRTLIAAELVFGVSGSSAGLGWFIFQNRNALETANVFAGLLTVIIIGLIVEGIVFRSIEAITVRRWGMQSS
ncbi:ABC transporter permease [Mesorhizobium sp. DCY119]|uniref:ABC transporter permease n=1 Tax=Mesorhizobium sp. DCY119 TaxID=2108445 RepID=UPI000E72CE8D|nr:ABC transporter permease [Mesorhizobium sp. DCY119]RJG40521.1 ABC transporter permease [Mesorhizobium sp. DCY119]